MLDSCGMSVMVHASMRACMYVCVAHMHMYVTTQVQLAAPPAADHVYNLKVMQELARQAAAMDPWPDCKMLKHMRDELLR